MGKLFFEIVNLTGQIVILFLMISTIPYILAFMKDIKRMMEYKRAKINFSKIAYLGQFHNRFYQSLNERQTKRRLLYSGLGAMISRYFSKFFVPFLYALGIVWIYLMLKETSEFPSILKNMLESLGIIFITIHSVGSIFKAKEEGNLNIFRPFKWIFVYSLVLIASQFNLEDCVKYCFLYMLLWFISILSEKIFVAQINEQWANVDIEYFELYWYQEEYSQVIKQRKNEIVVIFSELWSFKYGGKLFISTSSVVCEDLLNENRKVNLTGGVIGNDFNR
ncbi:hypothetical protein CIRMBP1284_00982 [Enterococcus cecorum]|nr:hypothetical protein [Enterococcus cecorum]MCJ0578787.1 hypothetical protein [Enterococcus cecorum]CAI3332334.1 hypothetical protein CIRMBP1281_01036 [Enterococcus cecorum]CAI3345116.1 hypothetical protein CIRMBP1284_00982 [Enterococcus cecorum]CAI3357499.1 hypothetical protein CIRMBP1296_00580 [Enterococcus cecorum]CAI3363698.1 hypothetical protein CIRMBP1282_01300 [Enterococcus cecorum]